MSEMRLARLCFDPSGGERIDTAGWTTVFTLGGLTLPDVAINREDYSYEQRLSVALMYLVSQFARRLMHGLDRHLPKAIFLDEAWAITQTPEGAKLIPEVSRMGRSRNTALILVSQNAGDLLNEQVTNCLSSVYSFRSTERNEVGNVMALLGVENSDEHRAVLRNLGNGECIFRDLDGRAGRIGVDLVSEELLRWLDTNPTRSKPGETGAQEPSDAHSGNEPTNSSLHRPPRPRHRGHPGGPPMRVPGIRRRRTAATARPRGKRRSLLILTLMALLVLSPLGIASADPIPTAPGSNPNDVCAPADHPAPEQYGSGIDGMVKPPNYPSDQLKKTAQKSPEQLTYYDRYGTRGQSWHAVDMGCSDMPGHDREHVANTVFIFAQAIDRTTITIYQAAASESLLGWLKKTVDGVIQGMGNTFGAKYWSWVVILGALWLAWWGLIRRRASRVAEGTIWMVLAMVALIWLIGRPGDFTTLGTKVSNGATAAFNAALPQSDANTRPASRRGNGKGKCRSRYRTMR